MTTGFASLNLRPIRFGMAVNGNDIDSVSEAVKVNTFLWGGTFNPIIPVASRMPKSWSTPGVSGRQMFEGYLDAFDPDFLVTFGNLPSGVVVPGNRKTIPSSSLLEGAETRGTPSYGVGLFEIASHLGEDEFKFVRREPLTIHLARPEGPYQHFLSTVFGVLSEQYTELLLTDFEKLIDIKKLDCSLTNYAEIIAQRYKFIRHVTGRYHADLRNAQYPLYGGCIFFLDASKPIDLIDYWNLRAAGWRLIPIPKQASELSNVRELAFEFIETHYFPHKFNPDVYHATALLKSRSVREAEFRNFFNILSEGISNPQEKPKLVMQDRYPRMWDKWAREADSVKPAYLDAGRARRDLVSDEDRAVTIRTLDPEFLRAFSDPSENPRYANGLSLTLFGQQEPYAEVIPEGDDTLNEALGGLGFLSLRFSKAGVIYLCRYLDESIHIQLPKAERVLAQWLKGRGWHSRLSDKGRIAKQMLKQLGGEWGIRPLENARIIQLLQNVSGGKTIKEAALKAETSRIAKEEGRSDSSGLIKLFTDHGMLQLGMEFQCPICTQHSWFSITEADYELQCLKCLEHFKIPTHAPRKIQWSYRSLGPFSLPDYAFGAYTILFTLSFFGKPSSAKKTPHFSFTAEKDSREIEVDLALLTTEFGFFETEARAVFAECKTYNHFKRIDVERMKYLASEFPGAILVFASLVSELTTDEKKWITALVKRSRASADAGRPFSPIMILTGRELFSSFGPPLCWNGLKTDRGALADRYYIKGKTLLSLCDITQQLHLGMSHWEGINDAHW